MKYSGQKVVRKISLADSGLVHNLIDSNGGPIILKQGFGPFNIGTLLESTYVNLAVELENQKLVGYICLNDSLKVSAESGSFEAAIETIVEFIPATVINL